VSIVDRAVPLLSGEPDALTTLARPPANGVAPLADVRGHGDGPTGPHGGEGEEGAGERDVAALVEKFPSEDAFGIFAAPIALEAGTIHLAVLDASDVATKGAIEHVTRMRVELVSWPRERIAERLRQLYPHESRSVTKLTSESSGIELWDRIQHITLRRHAQNLFIHPLDGGGGVARWVIDGRYDDSALATETGERPDGTLCALRLNQAQYDMLARRIERQAAMPEGTSSALTGIALRRDAAEAEGRVLRYLPTTGSAYFIRVLGSAKTLRTIEGLGIPKHIEAPWLAAIHGPMGLHAVVGPSGAGKNTTIAASLMTLRRSRLNVVSVERPRELTIPDVRQIELGDKDDPRQVLEDMLSCQPSLLYFTETKKDDVAEVLTQAARTGNQIVTSWHSRSALDAPDRLVDLGLTPRNAAASVDTVLAQRLLPRLCDCHSDVEPLELTDVVKRMLAAKGRSDLVDLAGDGKLWRPNEHGCPKCAYTGYNGLIGVFELLVMSPELKALVKNGALPVELEPVAVEQGYRPMIEAAYDYVRDGRTTLEAVASILITGFTV